MPRARTLTLPRPSSVFAFLADAEASRWKKLALLAAAFYVIFPIDLVPDLIPIWGWLDDAGAVTLALAFLSWAVAPYNQPVPVHQESRKSRN
jgi:uncharacterized membrane protein YkvA (DUF1232 family)